MQFIPGWARSSADHLKLQVNPARRRRFSSVCAVVVASQCPSSPRRDEMEADEALAAQLQAQWEAEQMGEDEATVALAAQLHAQALDERGRNPFSGAEERLRADEALAFRLQQEEDEAHRDRIANTLTTSSKKDEDRARQMLQQEEQEKKLERRAAAAAYAQRAQGEVLVKSYTIDPPRIQQCGSCQEIIFQL